jgi:hypothetical protein
MPPPPGKNSTLFLKMEAAGSFEMLIMVYHIPEVNNLHVQTI